MSYLAIRDGAVARIRAGMLPLFPGMRIEPHPGAFTEQTIKQAAQRTPAVLTSLVRAADGTHANSITFVSWVLYRASNEDRLYDGALKIVSALIPVIRGADFALDIKDTTADAECLYSGSLDAMAVTLWAVRREMVLGSRALPQPSAEGLGDIEGFDGSIAVGAVQTETNMEE